jgi:hypothetical protein
VIKKKMKDFAEVALEEQLGSDQLKVGSNILRASFSKNFSSLMC